MLSTGMRSWAVGLLAMAAIVSTSARDGGAASRIEPAAQPVYYLMADAGPSVTPNEPLRRTNRSLLKWWDDLFPRNTNCWLPELFPAPNPCGQCGGGFGLLPQLPQLQTNYVAPLSPVFGGSGCGVAPNNWLDKPGDGDAGYDAPPAPAPPAPAPPAPTYEVPAPPAPTYEVPAPPAPTYEAPAPPPAPVYNQPTPIYSPPEETLDAYEKPKEYARPSYAGQEPAKIVFQPIIYVSTPLAPKPANQVVVDDQVYVSPTPVPPQESYAAAPLPPSCQQAYAPPAPTPPPTPACQTPFGLSLLDQPYRVAPELFREYNYRLSLASQNVL
ncbi:uncharacterized protein LOC108021940 [Drosophila biarmipes]|uniref:uncharacterized protein LOC108021940 n=1 Tax=Drosophila biarmipes TaxID=125945 RepID=UPI0007E714CF|nr:uncharacterized protein LOC108021940 [Drosophila biarmipes]